MKQNHSIAIIGMAGRFPEANSVDKFWSNFLAGKECLHSFSDEELLAAGVAPELIQNPNYVRTVPIIDGYDEFDADFFSYSPREAEALDPQQRIFLQCAWHAMEDGGYGALKEQNVAVFAGSGDVVSSYLLSYFQNHPQMQNKSGSMEHLANDKDYLALRVSYKLDLLGPSVTIQAACTTSLVAIHMACENLRTNQCKMALAGGVKIRVPHRVGYLREEGSILSSDGRCRPFDIKGDGNAFGSGVGCVLLKRLHDALDDGDRIYAVIKGSAINSDGGKKLSFTAASQKGQRACIEQALADADVAPTTIGYVEAQSNGSSIGDPIEINALKQAFNLNNCEQPFCALGTKANIGHLDAASGVAGLIKATLAVYYGVIPPVINLETLNPKIKLDRSPFYIPKLKIKWPDSLDGKRRAGVNSSGMGGTNAFVVLEEPPKPKVKKIPQVVYASLTAKTHALYISAKTDSALRLQINLYLDFLQLLINDDKSVQIWGLCYSTQKARYLFENKIIVVGKTIAELLENLKSKNYFSEAGLEEHGFQYAEQELPYIRIIDLPLYPFSKEKYWDAFVSMQNKAQPQLALENNFLTRELLRQTQNCTAQEFNLIINKILLIELQKVLGIKKDLDITKNFMQMGLDSMMSIQLKCNLQALFGVKFDNTVFFEYPSLNLLANYISDIYKPLSDQEAKTLDQPIATLNNFFECKNYPSKFDGWMPLTAFQLIYWFGRQITSLHYVTEMISLSGEINPNVFKLAVEQLCDMHPMMQVKVAALLPRQKFDQKPLLQFSTQTLSLAPDVESKEIKQAYFELMKGGWVFSFPSNIKVKLLTSYDGKRQYVIVSILHVIGDAASVYIVFSDLFKRYIAIMNDSKSLPALPSYNLYFNYVVQDVINCDLYAKQKFQFWKDYCNDYRGVPFDFGQMNFSRQYIKVDNLVSKTISREKFLAFSQFCAENNLTLTKGLIALSGLMLSVYNCQKSQYVFNVISEQTELGLQNIFGCFIATELWKVSSNHNLSFRNHFNNFAKEILKVSAHQQDNYPCKWAAIEDIVFDGFQIYKLFSGFIYFILKILTFGQIHQPLLNYASKILTAGLINRAGYLKNKILGLIFKNKKKQKVRFHFYLNYYPEWSAPDLKPCGLKLLKNTDRPGMPVVEPGLLYCFVFPRQDGDIDLSLNGLLDPEMKVRVLGLLSELMDACVDTPDAIIADKCLEIINICTCTHN